MGGQAAGESKKKAYSVKLPGRWTGGWRVEVEDNKVCCGFEEKISIDSGRFRIYYLNIFFTLYGDDHLLLPW